MGNALYPSNDPNLITLPQTVLAQPNWRTSVTASVGQRPYGGDTLAPAMAVVVAPAPAGQLPGAYCRQPLPICIGDGLTFCSLWIHRYVVADGATPATPPRLLVELRCGDGGNTPETIASAVLVPDDFSPHGLLIAASGLPLCSQIEAWLLVDPAADDGTVVSVTLGLRVGIGGDGPLDVKLGDLVVGGLTPPGTVWGV